MSDFKRRQRGKNCGSQVRERQVAHERNKAAVNFCVNLTLIQTAVFCTLGALISAFSFPVSMWPLFIVWAVACALLSALAEVWRIKGIAAFAACGFVIALFMWEGIAGGGRWVVHSLTSDLSRWINISVMFSGAQESTAEVALFFTVYGIALAILLSIAICLYRNTVLVVLLTFPLVVLTFVVTSLAPDHSFIFSLIALYLVMIFGSSLSGSLSRGDVTRRGPAFFSALLIAVVIMGAAYFIAPQESDRGDDLRAELASTLDSQIRTVINRAGFTAERSSGLGWPLATSGGSGSGGGGASGAWSFDTSNIAVADAGARTITNQELLNVSASEAGVFYLRGYSIPHFDGRSWYAGEDDQDRYMQDVDIAARKSAAYIAHNHSLHFLESEQTIVDMVINTVGDFSNLDYLPYYSIDWGRYTYGAAHNQDLSAQYDYGQDIGEVVEEYIEEVAEQSTEFVHVTGSLIGLANELFADNPEYRLTYRGAAVNVPSSQYLAQYLQVNAETANWLRKRVVQAGIATDAERSVIVDEVAVYIRSAGRYTLTPGRTPAGEDFVRHFLGTSQQGYCIHFATAAVLMLRSLDIPARFTVGFLAVVHAGSENEVVSITDRHAHAWVEVFYDDIGWIPLEVTPSAGESIVPTPSPHTQAPERPEVVPATPEGEEADPTVPEPEVETPTPEPNVNAGSDPSAQEFERQDEDRDWTLLYIFAAALFAVAGVLSPFVRRYIVCKKRKRDFSQKDNNAAVISVWKYICSLSGKSSRSDKVGESGRNIPAQEIADIAQKARFSQHEISQGERNIVAAYSKVFRKEVASNMNWVSRFWLKYIRGL